MGKQLTSNYSESATTDRHNTTRSGSLPEKNIRVLHADAPAATLNTEVDEALQYASAQVTLTPEQNKRLLRKIDCNLQPLLCLVYGIQFLDKTCISYASIMGLRSDTNLTGGQYSTLGTMFYVGYLVWEFPTNRLLQKLPLAKYTACNIFVWGAILASMAACKNFASLAAVRFFLGMFESSITPGFSLFTSQWYRKSEQGTRTGWWFCWNGFAQIIGGCIAYGISKADQSGNLALAGWKVIFLFTGCITMGFGILVLYFMPDTPTKARFLNEEEKFLVIERIRSNQQGIGNKQYKIEQVKEAFTDPVVWLFVLYALVADIPNGGLTNFFSILIQSFGYSTQTSLLYSAPTGAVEVITILVFLWLGDRYKMRLFYGMISTLICVLGMSMVYAIAEEHKKARLVGYYLTGASATGFVVILSLISSNVAGYTKKTTVQAMTLVGYCVGNLIGPQTFRAKDAPYYSPAVAAIIACWSSCVLLLGLIWYLNVMENKRRDEICNSPGYVEKENQEFLDLTDRQNMSFRYVS